MNFRIKLGIFFGNFAIFLLFLEHFMKPMIMGNMIVLGVAFSLFLITVIVMPFQPGNRVKTIGFVSCLTGIVYIISMLITGSVPRKTEYLDDIFSSLQSHEQKGVQLSSYLKNPESFSTGLSQLALDGDADVSRRALSVINLLALGPHSPGWQTGGDLPDMRLSVKIKSALEQLISDVGIDDDLKASAIDAHSLLYPPENAIISEFEKIILSKGLHENDSLTAIFRAFIKYKKLYDFDMPVSTVEAARNLLNHPSKSVKIEVFYVLRESIGKPALPFFFNEIEKSPVSDVWREIILDIIAIDLSDETVDRLKKIAAKSPGSGIARLINKHTSPSGIIHRRKLLKNKELIKSVRQPTSSVPSLLVVLEELETTNGLRTQVSNLLGRILWLDHSHETVRKLKEIANRKPSETLKVRLIEAYIDTKNIDSVRKIKNSTKNKQ